MGHGVIVVKCPPHSLIARHYPSTEQFIGARVCQINGQLVHDSANQAAAYISSAPVGLVTILLQLNDPKLGTFSHSDAKYAQHLVVGACCIPAASSGSRLGLGFRQLLTGSVYISSLEEESSSLFATSPLKVGMHVVSIDNCPVTDKDQLVRKIRRALQKGGGILTILAESTVIGTPQAQEIIPTAENVVVLARDDSGSFVGHAPIVTATALPMTSTMATAVPSAPMERDLWQRRSF